LAAEDLAFRVGSRSTTGYWPEGQGYWEGHRIELSICIFLSCLIFM
jgi:hypothetical protein